MRWYKALEVFSKTSGFEKYVALSTSFIAVCLSLSTIFANQAGDDLLVNRAQANNEWSRFQSKSIKENLFEVQLETFKMEFAREGNSDKFKQKISEKMKHFEREIKRYVKEKNDIKKQAIKHENICKIAEAKGAILDLAEGFYQIALILAAISLVSRTAIIWVLSVLLGAGGISTTLFALLHY